jgi:UrcA family protein
MNRYPMLVTAALFASLTISSGCLAAPNDETVTLVRYGDLDLATPTGVRSLERRIETALNHVCLDPNGPGPAGKVDMSCKIDGRRVLQVQMAAAIAEQDARQTAMRSEVSIRFQQSPSSSSPKN